LKYGTYKIDTIGGMLTNILFNLTLSHLDAYLCCSGLLQSHYDKSKSEDWNVAHNAAALANMAFEMNEISRRVGSDLDKDIRIRIGIDTGPCTSGKKICTFILEY
jgi:class 3 adenylate cyclase